MATGGLNLRSNSAEENFSCPVCLEIFEYPVTLPCGHSFCDNCLDSCENMSGSTTCPVCRTGFNAHQKSRAVHIERQILRSTSSCPGCNRQFPVQKLRAHRASCTQMSSPSFVPVATTSQPRPEAKNRETFTCPYCYQTNLDCNGLLQHVNNNHKHEMQSVVCPICASMPWGNPNQKSGNFVHHLNLRHKFEYGTYVDYDKDEDAVLQQVLAQSLRDS